MTYALSPVQENFDGLRVVLTWGKTPEDLDSHMISPGSNIYFESKQSTDAELDVDVDVGVAGRNKCNVGGLPLKASRRNNWR